MKKKLVVGFGIGVIVAFWFLLLSTILFVLTYNTSVSYSDNQMVKGEIKEVQKNGLKTNYEVNYKVGEKEYKTKFSTYLVTFDNIELVLGTDNETVALGNLVTLEKSINDYCKYIICISGISLLIVLIVFLRLSRKQNQVSLERQNGERKDIKFCKKI